MESQPQNPEFRNNHETFHPCLTSSEGGWLQTEYTYINRTQLALFHFEKINFRVKK